MPVMRRFMDIMDDTISQNCCPRCGAFFMVSTESVIVFKRWSWYRKRCLMCELCGPWRKTEKEANEAWRNEKWRGRWRKRKQEGR